MEPRWYHSEMNLNMRNEKNEGRKENGLGSVYTFFWEGAFRWWLLRGDEGVSDRVCKEGIEKKELISSTGIRKNLGSRMNRPRR